MWTTDLNPDEHIVINTGKQEYFLTPTGGPDFLYEHSQGANVLTLSSEETTNLPGDVEIGLSRRRARFANQVRIFIKAPKSVTFTKRPCPGTNQEQ